jgi:UDP-N-acetylglucosamine:LPS N-acetylglucosamine transferase
MATVSAWIDRVRPDVIVCDVSVEVTLLARLHGVPVVCVAMPGDRSDAPHRLGYGIATELVGCWPAEAGVLIDGIRATEAARIRLVGAVSRFPVSTRRPRRRGPRRVVVMTGLGGSEVTAAALDRARSETPTWQWTVLDAALGTWQDDPFATLCDADVVVTHAGQNAVAEVAAARRPAIVVPSTRPHDEQRATARALACGPWPALVRDPWPAGGWGTLLEEAAELDGARWESWCDGSGARRLAGIVEQTALSVRGVA